MIKKLIKKYISEELVSIYRKNRYNIITGLVSFFSTNKYLTKIYYFIFSSEFDNEMVAVLKGRKHYLITKGVNGASSSSLLRRNIHRLEKGLSMAPRKKVFGESFILETIECLIQCLDEKKTSEKEIQWAYDVLECYFSVVSHTKEISKSYILYNEKKDTLVSYLPESDISMRYIPFESKDRQHSSIGFEDFSVLLNSRKSTRWFENVEVPIELINQAVDIASTAPSACNRQPFRVLVSQNKNHAVNIAKCAGGTGGFADNINQTLVVIGDLSCYQYERDKHLIYIDSSLFAMQLMLSLQVLGLATCPINWPDVELADKKISKVVDVASHERIIMLIAVGYEKQDGLIPSSPKKEYSTLCGG